VIVTGANDVWVVEGPFGEILIPVIADVVMGVSENDGVIVVRLLDGLMPGEGEFE
jgi:16S rRNA processing protein RimM